MVSSYECRSCCWIWITYNIYYTDHVCVTKEWWYNVSIFTLKLFSQYLLYICKKKPRSCKYCVCSNFDSKFKVLLPCLHSIGKKSPAMYYVHEYWFHKNVYPHFCSVIDYFNIFDWNVSTNFAYISFYFSITSSLFFYKQYYCFGAGKQYLSVDNHITYYSPEQLSKMIFYFVLVKPLTDAPTVSNKFLQAGTCVCTDWCKLLNSLSFQIKPARIALINLHTDHVL